MKTGLPRQAMLKVIALTALVLLFPLHQAWASAAERLAASLRIKTISYQDRAQIDYQAFQQFKDYLART